MLLTQLKIFRDIATEKSFVKAARLNFITQPSVSTHLKNLEDELGVKLFDRVPRRVTLTPDGELFLPYVEDILRKCEDLRALPKRLKKSPKGEVRIASIHSIGMYELGSFLTHFMRQYPAIRIHLEYQDAREVYELVLSKKVHIGMVAYPEKRPNIKTIPYGQDELSLIVPPGHRLAQRKRIKLEKIEGERFVAFDDSTPTRDHINKLLKQLGVQVNTQIVNNNIYALKKAVAAGLGVAIVPWGTVTDEVQAGAVHRIKIQGSDLIRPLGLLTLRKQQPSQVAQLFIDSLIKYNTDKKSGAAI